MSLGLNAEWRKLVDKLPQKRGYYDLAYGIQKKRLYTNQYLPELSCTTGWKILDIGAGCGFFCKVCIERGHSPLALLSPDKDYLAAYQRACSLLEVPTTTFTWGKGQPPFPPHTFDLVNSEGMIGMNPAEVWGKLLDDMFSVTKVGGIIMLRANAKSGANGSWALDAWEASKKNVIERISLPQLFCRKWRKL